MNIYTFSLLKEISKTGEWKVPEQTESNIKQREELDKLRAAYNTLVKQGLIAYCGYEKFMILDLGYQVAQHKDWLSYLKDKQATDQKRAKKEGFDYKISKFQANSQLLPYGLSLLSLIVAFFAYFKPVDKSDTKQLSKDEIIHIADSISTSNQTKKVDSLRNSKILNDSLN